MTLLRRGAWIASAFFSILLIVIHFTPLVPWYARLLAGDWADPTGQVLVVLAAELQQDGMIGESSYWRSVYAVRAYRAGKFRKVLISGGPRLSAPMREFLVCQGVPAEAVVIEEKSTSTRENALFSKPLLAAWPGPVVLLTSDYHMFRARHAFAKAGVQVLPHPFPDAIKRSANRLNRWASFWGLAAETAKIGYYKWNGWI